MRRIAAAIFAFMIAAPALAGTYTATPANAPAEQKIVTRDVAWNFAGGEFRGRTNESRPMILCQRLAKRAGRLSSFAADGRAFDAAQLEKCNAFAADTPAMLAERK